MDRSSDHVGPGPTRTDPKLEQDQGKIWGVRPIHFPEISAPRGTQHRPVVATAAPGWHARGHGCHQAGSISGRISPSARVVQKCEMSGFKLKDPAQQTHGVRLRTAQRHRARSTSQRQYLRLPSRRRNAAHNADRVHHRRWRRIARPTDDEHGSDDIEIRRCAIGNRRRVKQVASQAGAELAPPACRPQVPARPAAHHRVGRATGAGTPAVTPARLLRNDRPSKGVGRSPRGEGVGTAHEPDDAARVGRHPNAVNQRAVGSLLPETRDGPSARLPARSAYGELQPCGQHPAV